jgi:hypothetical protein
VSGNPIFDLWGGYMADMQGLWLLFLPVVVVVAIVNSIRNKFK